MNGSAKFLFDTDFKEVDPSNAFAESSAEKAPTFTPEQIDVARQEGRDEGRQEGRREALDEIEATAVVALQGIAETVEQARLAQEKRWSEAAQVAILVARKISAAAIAASPLAEIEATIEACLGELREEPRVAIRIAEPLVENLVGRLAGIVERHGLTTDIAVIGDDALAPGDCRIEWADGGAERIGAQIEAAIEEIVHRHLGARSEQSLDPADRDSDGE